MTNRPARTPRVERFRSETNPLVLTAMRKLFGGKGPDFSEDRCLARMTPEERAALDAWLQPRIRALAGILDGPAEEAS